MVFCLFLAPRVFGEVARLITPEYRALQPQCLTFWYHMYGGGVGTLKVYSQQSRGVKRKIGSDLFNQTGDMGDKWRIAQVTLPRAVRAEVCTRNSHLCMSLTCLVRSIVLLACFMVFFQMFLKMILVYILNYYCIIT